MTQINSEHDGLVRNEILSETYSSVNYILYFCKIIFPVYEIFFRVISQELVNLLFSHIVQVTTLVQVLDRLPFRANLMESKSLIN